jgi:hypothetical protein
MAYDRGWSNGMSIRSQLVVVLAVLAVLAGAAAWVVVPRLRDSSSLTIEWRPSVALAPGVSAREGRSERWGAWRMVDVSVDLARAELRAVGSPQGATLEHLLPLGAVAAVNGGFFDTRFHPTGWVVDQGVEIAPKQNRSSGGVLAVHGSELYIGPLAQLPLTPDFAAQNSPRLVEGDGQVGIHKDDGRHAARTAACDVGGRLHLVTLLAPEEDGPTLLEFARWLAREPTLGGLGCTAALNLDGGPSTGVWLTAASGLESAPPRAFIAYALAVVPRA